MKVRQLSRLSCEAIADLGALMEHHSIDILDASMLPLPKAAMKAVLREAISVLADGQQRRFAIVAYGHLAHFQENIGSIPVRHKEDNIPADATPDEIRQHAISSKNDPWHKLFSEKVDPEQRALEAELDTFMATIKDRANHIRPPKAEMHYVPSAIPDHGATMQAQNMDVIDVADRLRDEAARGIISSQIALAEAFINGSGVLQDFQLAVKWLKIAASQTKPSDDLIRVRIAPLLDLAEGRLSPEEREEAWMLARSWKKPPPLV